MWIWTLQRCYECQVNQDGMKWTGQFSCTVLKLYKSAVRCQEKFDFELVTPICHYSLFILPIMCELLFPNLQKGQKARLEPLPERPFQLLPFILALGDVQGHQKFLKVQRAIPVRVKYPAEVLSRPKEHIWLTPLWRVNPWQIQT